MVAAFPAYHQEHIKPDIKPRALRHVISASFESLGWDYEIVEPDTFVAKVPFNFSSWGEKFVVLITPDGAMEVCSKCILFTQCFDWGKNERNVYQFLEAFAMKSIRIPSYLLFGEPANFDESGTTPTERVFRDGTE